MAHGCFLEWGLKMACLECECDKCKSHWFTNDMSKDCPHCGAQNSVAIFTDEYPDEPPYYEDLAEADDDAL